VTGHVLTSMFKVSIFDQERKLFEDIASQVSLPGVEGDLAVLAFHAPMISLLRAGRISVDGKYLPIRQGVALVDRNELLVLVER
jgi:F0F1-type ATP synthase epsilon subunit